jgi:hypothetical protein
MRKIRVGYAPFQLVFGRDVDFEACPLSEYIEQTDGDVIFGDDEDARWDVYFYAKS